MPNWWDDCASFEACKEWTYWEYIPALSPNVAYAVLFGLSTVAFLGQGVLGKRWAWFTFSMVAGCLLEVVGYVGRILAYNNPYREEPFMIQIVCLTIAPAFLAAGIYLCLSRIVVTFGEENSRIKPLSYPRIFVPCDILSLVLQATGGGMASVAAHKKRDPKTGNNIMNAGLSVQVATLLVFIVLALDFATRTLRSTSKQGAQHSPDSRHAKLRESRMVKGFLVALSVSTLCIFTRCVFRVAELSQGWRGHLMQKENYFIGLEGAVVVVAVLLLNVFHPAFCFRGALDARGSTATTKSGNKWWNGRNKGMAEEPIVEQVDHARSDKA